MQNYRNTTFTFYAIMKCALKFIFEKFKMRLKKIYLKNSFAIFSLIDSNLLSFFNTFKKIRV